MVTFVSLFLWLMTGVHPVKVAVDPAAASVEFFLDGMSIGVATEPEWEVECDFGEWLRPHELVAVARDARGEEIGRAVQVVNIPRPDAEVEVVFEDGTSDAPTMLRVITESAERIEPLAVFVRFDSTMLVKEDDARFRLPTYDPRLRHMVSAEALYPDGITARRDLTFGGGYGGLVTTELTAVAVILDERRNLSTDDIQGLLRADGEILKVMAVERQGGRIYMVRDHRTWPSLRNAGLELDRRNPKIRQEFGREISRVLQDPGRYEKTPPDKNRFYLVVPNPAHARGLALYPIIQPFSVSRWGMPWLVSHIQSDQARVVGQHLAEAVAVAGLRAAADASPRAVVLVLGGEAVDIDSYPPETVREYLNSLRVPLTVWSTERKSRMTRWGEAEYVHGAGKLGKASRRLVKRLRRQWIVWVEGSHLPNHIELEENSLGIRLAG